MTPTIVPFVPKHKQGRTAQEVGALAILIARHLDRGDAVGLRHRLIKRYQSGEIDDVLLVMTYDAVHAALDHLIAESLCEIDGVLLAPREEVIALPSDLGSDGLLLSMIVDYLSVLVLAREEAEAVACHPCAPHWAADAWSLRQWLDARRGPNTSLRRRIADRMPLVAEIVRERWPRDMPLPKRWRAEG